MRSPKSTPTGGLFGTLKSVRYSLSETLSNYALFVMDGGLSPRRLKLFPEYKAHRRLPESECSAEDLAYRRLFKTQVPLVESTLPLLGVEVVSLDAVEGDDLIARLAWRWRDRDEDHEVVVVSEDKDLVQLVSPRIGVFRPMAQEWVTEDTFSAFSGVETIEEYLLAKAMIGDKSDGIDGIHGVGPVRATALLAEARGRDWKEQVQFEHVRAIAAQHPKKSLRQVATEWGKIERNLGLLDIRLETFEPRAIQLIELLVSDVQGARPKFQERAFREVAVEMGFNSLIEAWNIWVAPFRRLR